LYSEGALLNMSGLNKIEGKVTLDSEGTTVITAPLPFTQPPAGGTVVVSVARTDWMFPGQTIFVLAGGGYYTVTSVLSPTKAALTNLGTPANAAPGSLIPPFSLSRLCPWMQSRRASQSVPIPIRLTFS